MEKFAIKSSKKGDTVKLECEAEGDSPLTITWIKDSSKLKRTERQEITDTQTKDGIKSELVIRSTDRSDGGIYVCVAENVYGKDEKSNKLLVLETPAAPASLTLSEVWSRSASIAWAAPFAPNIPITGYIIQFWMESNGENKRLEEEVVSPSHTSFLLKNLQPGSHYEATVIAMNEVGRGPASPNLRFKTGEEEPAGAPLDFVAEPKGPTTIRVSWKSPPVDKWNGNSVGFYVGFRSASDYSRPYSLRTVPFVNISSTYEYFLSGLNRGTEYSVIVKAYNNAGSGPESQEMIAKTVSGDLPPAPKVFVISVTSDSVSLIFKMRPDELRFLRLSGFTVHHRPDAISVWKEVSIPIGMNQGEGDFIVKDLTPNSVYHFYVTAVNNYGHGDPSQLITIKTRATDSFLGDSLLPGDQLSIFGGFQQDIKTFVIVGAIVVVLLTLIVSLVCIKKAKLEAQKPPFDYLTATLGRPGAACDVDGGAYVETMRRYVDLDSTGKPVMQGNVTVFSGGHELKSFASPGKQQQFPRPLPQPNEGTSASSRNDAYLVDTNVYDCPQYD